MKMAPPRNSAVQIRSASPAEAGEIAHVLRASFAEFEPLYTKAAFDATAPAPDEVVQRMKEGPVWVAARDGEIVGTAAVLLTSTGVYVRGMAVVPAARGHRIGHELLTHIEAFSVARRAPRLYLSTTPFLTQAIRLYKRHGFRRIAEAPHDLYGTPLFTLEKRL